MTFYKYVVTVIYFYDISKADAKQSKQHDRLKMYEYNNFVRMTLKIVLLPCFTTANCSEFELCQTVRGS